MNGNVPITKMEYAVQTNAPKWKNTEKAEKPFLFFSKSVDTLTNLCYNKDGGGGA